MLTQEQFEILYKNAKEFSYSSFGPLEFDECKESELIQNNKNIILICNKQKDSVYVNWAADDPLLILPEITHIKEIIRVNFIPKQYLSEFKNAGFSIWAEYLDFFNNNLLQTGLSIGNQHIIEFLHQEDVMTVEKVSRTCVGFSRGFTGETAGWFLDWLTENDVIIERLDNEIVGYCCVSIYNGGSILFIREIGVDPVYHGKGLGRSLMEQAILYGIRKGASRGFLHVDKDNTKAISLYGKYGFNSDCNDGEIQLIRFSDKNS